jgi:hypothetical protein
MGVREMTLFPQPAKNATVVYDVVCGVLADFFPGGATIKTIVDTYLQNKRSGIERLLLEAISERGIGAIDEEQFEFYVPAIYRFVEQVRVGEYEHNLRVLAALIADGCAQASGPADAGVISRAAKRLELISFEELVTLAATKAAWDMRLSEGPTLQSEFTIDNLAILRAHDAQGQSLELPELAERLHELSVRGLLLYSPPSGFFHGGYAPTRAFNELINAVTRTVVKNRA